MIVLRQVLDGDSIVINPAAIVTVARNPAGGTAVTTTHGVVIVNEPVGYIYNELLRTDHPVPAERFE